MCHWRMMSIVVLVPGEGELKVVIMSVRLVAMTHQTAAVEMMTITVVAGGQ
jgi:hypothetical protein